MKTICNLSLLMLLASSMAGCASESQIRELDPDAFSRHFSAQRACMAYIDSLVAPIAEKLSAKRTPEEMRAWLHEHQDNAFSELVARVQRDTVAQGALDPRRQSDQIKVTMRLFEVLRERPDFQASSCGSDVREFVMESLYLGIGGERAPVVNELRQRGIEGSWEQRWVLLTSLMAGVVATNSD